MFLGLLTPQWQYVFIMRWIVLLPVLTSVCALSAVEVAHRICDDNSGETVVESRSLLDCYQNTYRDAAKAQLAAYDRQLRAEDNERSLKYMAELAADFLTSLLNATSSQ